jgi:predicted metal-binding membrane protein
MTSARASTRGLHTAFLGVCALIVAVSTAATIVWCTSMSAMGRMAMPGGWTMSMMWMRMPGRTWAGAATSFIGMWSTMMVAMMLPSLVPMLLRYRHAVSRKGPAGVGWKTTLVAIGYFSVWTVCGAVIFPLGATLAATELRVPALARAVPYAIGVVVLIAGTLQFTPWKAHHLGAWRNTPACAPTLSVDGGTAWRHGLRLGQHCVYCCAGPTAVLLGLGVMDLRAMAVVTAAVGAERLAPAGERVARGFGVLSVAAGLFLITRAVGI